MRRLGALDRILLYTLGPLWLGCVWISLGEGLRHGQLRFPIVIRSAESGEAFPSVWEPAWAEDVADGGYAAGDEVRRIGDADARGLSMGGATLRLIEQGRTARAVDVTFARGDRVWTERLEARSKQDWWTPLPFSVACALAVTLVLVRRPDWHLSRRLFVAGMFAAVGFPHYFGLAPLAGWAAALALVVAIPLALAILLDAALDLPRPRGLPIWQRAFPPLWSAAYAAQFAAVIWWAPPFSLRGYLALRSALIAVWACALVATLASGYGRADALERRQLRWVVYGFYVGTAPMVAAFALHALGIPAHWQRVAYAAGSIAMAAVPLGILVAVIWFDLLDVDRLISATTWYTLLVLAGAATLLGLSTSLAPAAASAAGVAPSIAQLGLGLALAAAAVPVTRTLRPHLDRRLFADRDALARGIDGLLEELARPARAPELVALAGERLNDLLRPEALVVYAREGEAFEPVFARGAAVAPPALAATSPLVAAVARRSTPLATARALERPALGLSDFDRAAVEALGAAVVVPVRRGDALAAFVCLGPKRSGDVYTATDTALLAAVASRLGERLTQLGDSERLREARGREDALRRYVPAAVAERLARGETLTAGEREVAVLFVDVRGYTSLAEGLRAPEIFATVNRYTERASSVIAAHGGAVVEFHGDGLLAVFGAPDPLPHKERAAVAAACELVRAMETPSGEGAGPPLSVGVGVATGSAFVGNVRSHDREIWTVLGNTTNLAARLQALTRELGASIAIDAATRGAAGDACAGFTLRPALPIRGRSAPVDVWVLV